MNITEEQVREVLEKWNCHYGVQVQIVDDVVRVMIAYTKYLISSDMVVDEDSKGIQIGFNDMSGMKGHSNNYSSDWCQAMFEIQSLLSEPTLQEQVEEILKNSAIIKPSVTYVGTDRVELTYSSGNKDKDIVYPDDTTERLQFDGTHRIANDQRRDIADTSNIEEYKDCLYRISALLTPPSLESQIAEQQRVIDGLREEKDELDRACSHLGEMATERKLFANGWYESYRKASARADAAEDECNRLQRENESLIEKFGPIDEAECKAAASVTELAGLVAKQADIQDEIFQMLPELMRNIATEVVQVQGRANRCSCGPAC